ncbi:hypothetical protein QN277_003449 [Acacia crassicarpa]|uniref:Uncharacterized protein n=1 Tax=Acacia crassicarpa TaxID=499986 RepID=A0AAE1MAV4_9FABA|nr:hypothetical protein QN277_003449 [Acacia crassicarpa]
MLGHIPGYAQIRDGIILGADTRATEGPIVADKNCEKIHYMAPNIYCCGAAKQTWLAHNCNYIGTILVENQELLRHCLF